MELCWVLCGSLDGRAICGENGYMYMYDWVPSLFTWSYGNIVNQLCPNTDKKFKRKKELPLSPLCLVVRVFIHASFMHSQIPVLLGGLKFVALIFFFLSSCPDLAIRSRLSWWLFCPLDIFPSFSEHVPALWHNKTFQAHSLCTFPGPALEPAISSRSLGSFCRKDTYLFLKFLLPHLVLDAAHGLCSCGVRTLSWGLWDLVPRPGIKHGHPALGVMH